MGFQDMKDDIAKIGWRYILRAHLKDTRPIRFGVSQQNTKVEIVSEYHMTIFSRPAHNFRIPGICRTDVCLMHGFKTILL